MAGDYRVEPLSLERLGDWFELLERAFQAKGTPRAYFERHWYNDPTASPEDVMVVVDAANGRMVSTVRVFRRSLRMGALVVPMGGIGEVATHPDYRQRGLAQLALEAAVRHMQALKIAVSQLHTSNAAVLYARLGWLAVPIASTRAVVAAAQLAPSMRVRQARLDDQSADTAQLKALHRQFTVLYAGCLERDDTFWRGWFPRECAATGSMACILDGSEGQPAASGYAVVGRGPLPVDDPASCMHAVVVRELVCHSVDDARMLLCAALYALVGSGAHSVHVRGYGALLADAVSALSASATIGAETGFMYRLITPFQKADGQQCDSTESLAQLLSPHMFLSADAY